MSQTMEEEQPLRFALIDLEFDPTRAPASEEAAQLCQRVLQAVLEYEQTHGLRKRQRKAVDQGVFERMVSALVCNVLYQHFLSKRVVALIEGIESEAQQAALRRLKRDGRLSDREKARRQKESKHHRQARQDWKEQSVHLSLSNRYLGAGLRRYRHPVMSQALPGTVKLMVEAGFLTKTLHGSKAEEGFGFPARQTCIQPDPRLLDLALTALRPRNGDGGRPFSPLSHFRHEHILPGGKLEETIILKSKKEKGQSERLEYAESDLTHRYREEMATINAFLAQADLEALDAAGQPMFQYDTRQRFLKRHFNNGRFDCGGRLFGGFWMSMPKAHRSAFLRIQGEPVLTLDYGQMAPRILYALKAKDKGSIPPVCQDCYEIQGLEGHRKGIKKLLNAALNRGTAFSRFPDDVKKLFPKVAKVGDIFQAIKEAHPALAPHLCTDEAVGLEIQFVESSIMVDVLLRLYAGTEDGQAPVAALPVHDAVIVPASTEQVAKETMRSVFMERTGIDVLVACSCSDSEEAAGGEKGGAEAMLDNGDS